MADSAFLGQRYGSQNLQSQLTAFRPIRWNGVEQRMHLPGHGSSEPPRQDVPLCPGNNCVLSQSAQRLEARRIASQLFDSGTSVASNYRAACRGRSRAEFIAKLGIVIEEADEAEFWLALLKGADVNRSRELEALIAEAAELRAIFTASRKTARMNAKRG